MKRILLFAFSFVQLVSVAQPGAESPDFRKHPKTQWRFKSTKGFISSPVIRENLVYIAGLDSTVYALELTTGTVKWKLRTNGEIRSTVLVDESRLFLVGGNGVLSCIDRFSGKPIWRSVFDNTALFLGERKYDWADYYQSSPLLHEGVLYFGTANGEFRAVSAKDGSIIWRYSVNEIIHTTPVLIQHQIVFGAFDGSVYALNQTDGTLRWKFKSVGHRYFPRGEMQGAPAIGEGSVFIGSRDYNFYALDAERGTAHWNRKFQNGWALAATTLDTVVYVGTSDDRVLLALDARDGTELWKTPVKFNIFGGCAFSKSMLYVGTIWGKLYGLDRQSGAVQWAFATDGYGANHLRYYKPDDTFRDDIGLILKSPLMWLEAEAQMGGIFSTPAVSGDWMVVSTMEGLVYGLKRD